MQKQLLPFIKCFLCVWHQEIHMHQLIQFHEVGTIIFMPILQIRKPKVGLKHNVSTLSPTTSLLAFYIPPKQVFNTSRVSVPITLPLLFILPFPCTFTIKFHPLFKIQLSDTSSMKLSLFLFKQKQPLSSSYTFRGLRSSLDVVILSSTLLVIHMCSFSSLLGQPLDM